MVARVLDAHGAGTGSGRAAPRAAPPAAPAAVDPDGDGEVLHGALRWGQLRQWAMDLGFSQIGITGPDLHTAEAGLQAWLDAGHHGGMGYMAAHGLKRARPAELVPGTQAVISLRMDYLPAHSPADWATRERQRLLQPGEAVVSLYARGRDYHKLLRQRLQALADRLQALLGPFGHRAFTDSAPVLEVELATRAGIAWRGKHTLALARDAGSMFFLGELFVALPLPTRPWAGTAPDAVVDGAADGAPINVGGGGGINGSGASGGNCGTCTACLAACPTGAITAPHRLDARRCISYLTIEHDGPIPEPLRPLLGNRIYGCDDCQLVCPWNKFARPSALPDFDPRPGLGGDARLLDLWAWDEATFLQRTAGSAIRRIGHARWQRNLAVAMGNALAAAEAPDALRQAIRRALAAALPGAGALLAEHIAWALAQAPAGPPGRP